MSDITVDGHLKLGERRLGMIEYRKMVEVGLVNRRRQ